MANFTIIKATATIGTTEFSLPQNANYSSGSPKVTTGYVQAFIDLSAMAAGDQYQIKIYERVNAGTQLPAIDPITLTGAQGQHFVTPMLLLDEGWDITVKKLAGTDRSIKFSVRQDTNDVNAASIASGAIAAATFAAGAITSTVIAAAAIGASQLGAAALTAAKFATDALDANALAAGAVTEIQTGLATSSALTTAQTDLTTLTGRLTAGRATGLDNLDAATSSRAPGATALSTAQWTNTRATLQDNLDVAVSTRSSAAALTAVASSIAGLATSAALAAVSSAVSALPAAATIAASVWGTISEGAETVLHQLRMLRARELGKATVQDGDGAYTYRDAADTKNRLVMNRTGSVRTTTTADGT